MCFIVFIIKSQVLPTAFQRESIFGSNGRAMYGGKWD